MAQCGGRGNIDSFRVLADEVAATDEFKRYFGEMCVLERLPRSASVQAVTETHLVLLSYATFDILFEQMPLEHHRVLSNIARSLSARLRELGDEFALRT